VDDSRRAQLQAGAERDRREREFEALFRQHWGRISRALAYLVGDPDEAQDLALEAFWRLYRRPPAHTREVGGWLYRVATNLGYNWLRARRRRDQYETVAGLAFLDESAPPGPDDAQETAALRARVQAVLAELGEREAQILTLRYSGLSYAEVAAALGVAPGSVGTLLARAEAAFERAWVGRGE
jgi:RNA polymerase sigma-70 factor (ECF subfamily)